MVILSTDWSVNRTLASAGNN